MITRLSPKDPNYPALAKNRLLNAPALEVLGNVLVLSKPCIAIIGSRHASEYSTSVVSSFVEEFSLKAIAIISGLAPGVDFFAHTSALSHKCATIGVLGFGLNYLQEFENYSLVKQIINSGGCVVSPFKSSQRPEKSTFVERNSLIAALSNAVVVVEATIKSGTFYTVRAAVDFDVPIFAVPGNIFSKNSKGTHSLVKSGAYLADCPQDVTSVLDFDKTFL